MSSCSSTKKNLNKKTKFVFINTRVRRKKLSKRKKSNRKRSSKSLSKASNESQLVKTNLDDNNEIDKTDKTVPLTITSSNITNENKSEIKYKENNTQTSNNVFYMQYLKGICFIMLCKKLITSVKTNTPTSPSNISKNNSKTEFSRSSSMFFTNKSNNNNKTITSQTSDYNLVGPSLLKPIETIPSEYDDDCFNKTTTSKSQSKFVQLKTKFNSNKEQKEPQLNSNLFI